MAVQGMDRHDADGGAVMYPDAGHRSIRAWSVDSAAAESRGHPNPAILRAEHPPAIVIREPAPRRAADEVPAHGGVPHPVAIVKTERAPAHANSKRLPTVPVARQVVPRTVVIQVGEAGTVIRRIHILVGIGRRGRDTVNPAGNPLIEVIAVGDAPNDRIAAIIDVDGIRLPLG